MGSRQPGQFEPATDAGDLSTKVFLVTGGARGLGRSTVLALAKLPNPPASLCILDRPSLADEVDTVMNAYKASLPTETAVARSISFIPCDLSSLQSIQEASRAFLRQAPTLDVLLCNAGVIDVPENTTTDGYEIHFGINCLSHALLVKLLKPALDRSIDGGRVVLVSSISISYAWVTVDKLKTAQGGVTTRLAPETFRYGQSKLAVLLYGMELARKNPSLTVISVHPGAVQTPGLMGQAWGYRVLVWVFTLGGLTLSAPDDGCLNHLWACTVNKAEVGSGKFYGPVGKEEKSRHMVKTELARELFEWMEGELKDYQL